MVRAQLQRHLVGFAVLATLSLPSATLGQDGLPSLPVAPTLKCPEECPYSLTGVVVNAATAEPVARALVVATGPVMAGSLTDAKGAFTLEQLPAGPYQIVAGRPGYLSSPVAHHPLATRAVYATAGPDSSPLTLRLVPQALIHGVVTDADGIPLEGASVHILKVANAAGRPRWQEVGQSVTDGLGRYRAADLAEGQYCVMANAPSYPGLAPPGHVSKEAWGYPPVSAPCNGTQSVDGGLELKAGEERAQNLSVRLSRFRTVSGRVDLCDAKQGGQASLYLVPVISPDVLQSVTVDPDGKFHSAAVAPGDYVLTAMCRGVASMSAQIPLTVAEDVTGIRLKLEPLMSIPISVVADEVPADVGLATPANFQQGSANRPVVSINMMRSDYVSGMASGIASRSGGVLAPVAPGVYVPTISAMGPWYIESATHAGTDLLRDDWTVSPGADREPIFIVLRSGCGSVKGTLQGEVDSLTSVTAVPDNGKRAYYQTARAIGSPEFTMTCMAPGDYTLVATQNGPDQDSGPETVAPYLAQGTRVTVTAGQESSVTLKVATRGER